MTILDPSVARSAACMKVCCGLLVAMLEQSTVRTLHLSHFHLTAAPGGIRQTILAHWPDQIAANSTSEHLFTFWDFLPTAADIAGVELPPGLDGMPRALRVERGRCLNTDTWSCRDIG